MRFGPALGLALALNLFCQIQAAEPQRAEFLQSFTWRAQPKWFGGISGVELAADGNSLSALTDDAMFFTADISRETGKITDLRITGHARLRSSVGDRLRGWVADSEGLAVAPDGTIYVSFEGIARIGGYDTPDAKARLLPRPPAFRALPNNGALEALAIDPAGRLYTLPEDQLSTESRNPVYRWDGRAWTQPFSLPPRGAFRPVGADFGPDGRFYLLERTYNPLGFRSRLRRWDLTAAGPTNEETLLQTPAGTHDNLEGVSIWRASDGRLRATMVSDDNFLIFQRTELVEYALPE